MKKRDRPLAPVLRLVPSKPQQNDDAVNAAYHLLRGAVEGRIVGLAYVSLERNGDHACVVAGECASRPIFTRGLLKALDDAVAKMQ